MPAQGADGRRGIGDSFVHLDGRIGTGHPGEQAALKMERVRDLSRCEEREQA